MQQHFKDELENKFNFQYVLSRNLEEDTSLHCFQMRRNSCSKKIASTNLTHLLQFIRDMNCTLGNYECIRKCTLIATADRNHKIICFLLNPHKLHMSDMFNNIFNFFSSSNDTKDMMMMEKNNILSIDDVLHYAFYPDYDVQLNCEEEYFDENSATFFIKTTFQNIYMTDRIVLDLESFMNKISANLTRLNLQLSQLHLFDVDEGAWNEMRLCLQVKKYSKPIEKYKLSIATSVTSELEGDNQTDKVLASEKSNDVFKQTKPSDQYLLRSSTYRFYLQFILFAAVSSTMLLFSLFGRERMYQIFY